MKTKPSRTSSVPAEDLMTVLGYTKLPVIVHGLINHKLPHLCIKEKDKTKKTQGTDQQDKGADGMTTTLSECTTTTT